MSRKSAVQHAQYSTSRRGGTIILDFRSSLQRGKRLQMARHRATVARQQAFLDLKEASEKSERWHKRRDLAKRTGRKMDPLDLPPDVNYYLECYRMACDEQKRVKGRD